MNLSMLLQLTFLNYCTVIWMIIKVASASSSNKQYLDRLREVEAHHHDDDINKITFHTGSRPLPSDQLPIPPLHENPDRAFDPSTEDLDYKTLRRMIGKKFDRNFMQVVKPLEHIFHPNGTLNIRFRKGRPKGRRPGFIKDFGSKISFGKNIVKKLGVDKRTKKIMQKYLWNYTHCPIIYRWKNLGIRFWPQWIKEGSCYKGRSCSVPPGMMCKTKNSKPITLLRWHCKDWNKDRQCKWIEIQYPIITECGCSC